VVVATAPPIPRHKIVYPVDVEGEFPFQRTINYAKASGRSKELEAMVGKIGGMVKGQSAYLSPI
jgi:hypothetical protein